MQRNFLNKLGFATLIADIDFVIVSGYRCEDYNKKFGKGKNHTEGCSAHIACNDDWKRGVILGALIKAGFRRIGMGERFIHVDSLDETGEAQRAIWFIRQ